MATKTVVCPGCGAAVPYGRLSCAACGTLLASVSGTSRRAPKRSTASAARGSSTRRADPAATAEAAVSTVPLDEARSAATVRPRSQSAATEPIPPLPAADIDVPADAAAPATAPTPAVEQVSTVAPAASPAPEASLTPEAPSLAVGETPAPPPILDDWTGPRPSVAKQVDGEEWSVVAPRPDVARSAEPPLPSSVPGAYLAPSAVISADRRGASMPLTTAPRPAASAALASAATTTAALPSRWYSASSSDAAATYPSFGTPGPTARPVDPAAAPKTGLFARLRSPEGAGEWATAVGSVIAAVAFVLPWARNGVLGTQGDRTYLGQWGLANPAYLLLFAASIALLIVTIVPNKLPREARAIALPLLLGGLLLGLAWSYLTGPFGTGPGVDAMALGAVLLVAGGLLDLRPARRSAPSQP